MSLAETEFKTIDLRDVRSNRRAIKPIENLGLAPWRTIRQTFQLCASTKTCYNFLAMV